jgi:hypothetical protein
MYSPEEEFEESLEGSRSAVSCTSPGSSARSMSVCGGSTVMRKASSSGG